MFLVSWAHNLVLCHQKIILCLLFDNIWIYDLTKGNHQSDKSTPSYTQLLCTDSKVGQWGRMIGEKNMLHLKYDVGGEHLPRLPERRTSGF